MLRVTVVGFSGQLLFFLLMLFLHTNARRAEIRKEEGRRFLCPPLLIYLMKKRKGGKEIVHW